MIKLFRFKRQQFANLTKSFHTATNSYLATSAANGVQEQVQPENAHNRLTESQINQICTATPMLQRFNRDLWHKSHNLFIENGFSTEYFLNIITKHPKLLSRCPNKLFQSIECWRIAQFGNHLLCDLIEEYPELLDYDNVNDLRHRLAYLKMYALTSKNIWRLLMSSPNLLGENEESINAKIGYLNRVMKVEVTDVVKSSVFTYSLEEIKCRHVFTERLGLFKPKNPKVEEIDNKNPRMHQIYDSDEKTFATKVCGVSLDEFETFQLLYSKELKLKEDDDEDELYN